MEVKVGKNTGYCFGVKRAVDIVKSALRDSDNNVYSLGPLIHNPQTNEKLADMGLIIVEHLDEIDEGSLVIRSHGLRPDTIEEAKLKGLRIIDATCPLVKKVQDYAKLLFEEGYKLFILGEPHHPEIKAVAGFTQNNAIVVKSDTKIDISKDIDKVGVVIQTTQILDKFREIIFELIKLSNEFRLYNTVCNATYKRQQETIELSKNTELMIIVGGKNSANTAKLKEVSDRSGCRTYHIEDIDEINIDWFRGVNSAGIMGGASTPDWIIKKVLSRIKNII
jgi:4-hydroxy-3-methylbut-2-enyl diphosphate reductase